MKHKHATIHKDQQSIKRASSKLPALHRRQQRLAGAKCNGREFKLKSPRWRLDSDERSAHGATGGNVPPDLRLHPSHTRGAMCHVMTRMTRMAGTAPIWNPALSGPDGSVRGPQHPGEHVPVTLSSHFTSSLHHHTSRPRMPTWQARYCGS